MSLKYVQAPIFYLAGSGALIGATSITVTTFTDIYGNVLTMSDFGAEGYCTLEPDSTNAEAMTFTGVTANANGTYTLTGVKTALAKSPYTETSGLVRNHAGGTKIVITDSVAFWNTFGNKQNDETLIGRWGTGVAPLAGNDLVNKTYADGLAIAGAPDASTSTKGISKTSVAPVSATSPIVVGQNDPKFVEYYADTGAANAYVITPVISIGAYATGQRFSFKSANANTTTSTLNINGLGAKTIKNSAGANLAANDILSGQIVVVEYDGTNFQMLSVTGNGVVDLVTAQTVGGVKAFSSSPTAPTPSGSTDVVIKSYVDGNPITSKNGASSRAANTASGSQTIAHGLGRTPKLVQISARKALFNSGANQVIMDTSDGWYNGSITATVYNTANTRATHESLSTGTDTTNIIFISDASGTQSATISVDATNITLTWTLGGSGTGDTINFIWMVQ